MPGEGSRRFRDPFFMKRPGSSLRDDDTLSGYRDSAAVGKAGILLGSLRSFRAGFAARSASKAIFPQPELTDFMLPMAIQLPALA
jgi:hypothetical protein